MTGLLERLCALALLAFLSAGACACKSSSPTEASPPAAPSVNLAGSWRGSALDSSGQGSLTAQLTQSGSNVSGTIVTTVAGTSIAGRGTVAGTLTGSTIRMTIAIPAGGFDAPFGSCTASMTGDGEASASSIRVTYSGNNSCAGPVTDGHLILSKE